ncbi:hypothetical protein [Fluviispira multicolorata]|uniref:hypothetical protein n=1 Tax=Fluviispira multicolorata TaxID=2654512 RepID=UPI001375616E|nr:hypothetical protein [Fluviispira multicolorata]
MKYKEADDFNLSQKIEANIYEEKIPFFESALLKKWQNGLHDSVKNIIKNNHSTSALN